MKKTILELGAAVIALITAIISLVAVFNTRETIENQQTIIDNQNSQLIILSDSMKAMNLSIVKIEKQLKIKIKESNISGVNNSTTVNGNTAGRDVNVNK